MEFSIQQMPQKIPLRQAKLRMTLLRELYLSLTSLRRDRSLIAQIVRVQERNSSQTVKASQLNQTRVKMDSQHLKNQQQRKVCEAVCMYGTCIILSPHES